jgi:hypothetical protein
MSIHSSAGIVESHFLAVSAFVVPKEKLLQLLLKRSSTRNPQKRTNFGFVMASSNTLK